MKKISKYLLLLAAAVFTFTACEKNVEREPSPLDVPGTVMFTSAGGSYELNVNKDKLETTVTLFRTSNFDQPDTILLKVEADPVFTIDPKVVFAPGDRKVSMTVGFPNGEVDSTYTFKLTMPEDKTSPYLDGQSVFTYTVKLVLWSEIRTGVFVDQTVGPAFGLSAYAWYVKYQVAENPDGSQKIRIHNPYASYATSQDADGILDGDPIPDDGEVDESKPYNFDLLISKEGEVTFPDLRTYLGIGWGDYTEQCFVDYARGTGATGTYGRFESEKGKIIFDAQDNSMLFGAGGKIYGIQANFLFYLSKDAFLADQEEPVVVDADVTTYEGHWAIKGTDPKDETTPVSANVTVTSYEDPKAGQFYAIEGLFADMPVVYGVFDETTHMFQIQPTKGDPVDIEGTSYVPYLYMLDADLNTSGSITLDIVPGEGGTLVPFAESAAVGFIIVYINPADKTDQQLGEGMFDISFEPLNAGAPARKVAAAKRANVKKALFPMSSMDKKIR